MSRVCHFRQRRELHELSCSRPVPPAPLLCCVLRSPLEPAWLACPATLVPAPPTCRHAGDIPRSSWLLQIIIIFLGVPLLIWKTGPGCYSLFCQKCESHGLEITKVRGGEGPRRKGRGCRIKHPSGTGFPSLSSPAWPSCPSALGYLSRHGGPRAPGLTARGGSLRPF